MKTEYEYRKQVYTAAVDALFAKGYLAQDADYKQLKTAVENAVIDLDVARLKLDGGLNLHSPARA